MITSIQLLLITLTGWVQKRLIKLYVDCCKELSETPNIKLLKKLYNLEVWIGYRRLMCAILLTNVAKYYIFVTYILRTLGKSNWILYSCHKLLLGGQIVLFIFLFVFWLPGFRGWSYGVWMWLARYINNAVTECFACP